MNVSGKIQIMKSLLETFLALGNNFSAKLSELPSICPPENPAGIKLFFELRSYSRRNGNSTGKMSAYWPNDFFPEFTSRRNTINRHEFTIFFTESCLVLAYWLTSRVFSEQDGRSSDCRHNLVSNVLSLSNCTVLALVRLFQFAKSKWLSPQKFVVQLLRMRKIIFVKFSALLFLGVVPGD